MRGIFINKTLEKYRHRSYEQRGRVKTMLYMDLILFPAFLFILVGMNIIEPRPLFDPLNIVMISFLIINAGSLLLLRLGFYNAAANLFIFAVTIGLVFNSYGTSLKGSPERFVASFFPWTAALIFSAFFCTLRVLAAIVAIQLPAYVYLIYFVQLVSAPVRGIVFFDFIISVVLSVIICVLSVRIYLVARSLRRDETDREREAHMEINRSLLSSLTEVSAELDESSVKMSGSIETFSGNIADQAASMEEITATMEQIEGGSENLSTGATEQSSAIKTLIGSMAELSAITNDIVAKITSTLSKTEDIAARAESGEGFIQEMNARMGEIGETSREMTGIVSMISDISDKINLLSLNASIEAARAGDAGRGFAVVADEVSKLADQTSSSVKDIERLIKQSENEIARGMEKVQDAVSVITGIISGVNEINGMMGTLSANMDHYMKSHGEVNRDAEFVKKRSDEIKSSAEEQKKAAEETTKTISGINELSQSNSQWAEDMSLLSRSIAERARDLREKIGKFDLTLLDITETGE